MARGMGAVGDADFLTPASASAQIAVRDAPPAPIIAIGPASGFHSGCICRMFWMQP